MKRLKSARKLQLHASRLRAAIQQSPSIEERARVAIGYKQLRAIQKPAEIVELLHHLQSLRPVRICEIGTANGGTLALLASVATERAQLLSLDIAYTEGAARAFRSLMNKGQSLTCIEADSRSPETLAKVKQWLGSDQLDFLLIDGDHSYAAVKSDFEMYAPLVRQGGIIAFHDIVPDYRLRYGIHTTSFVGDVPQFWNEIKLSLHYWRELIEDPDQDGYGIGIVIVT